MASVVKTRIVKIGNSQGIRIPKLLLDQLALSDEVELEVQHNQLVVRSVAAPRHGWDAHFEAMAQAHDDELPDDLAASPTQWDDEWDW